MMSTFEHRNGLQQNLTRAIGEANHLGLLIEKARLYQLPLFMVADYEVQLHYKNAFIAFLARKLGD